jgi:hypothetical protein
LFLGFNVYFRATLVPGIRPNQPCINAAPPRQPTLTYLSPKQKSFPATLEIAQPPIQSPFHHYHHLHPVADHRSRKPRIVVPKTPAVNPIPTHFTRPNVFTLHHASHRMLILLHRMRMRSFPSPLRPNKVWPRHLI